MVASSISTYLDVTQAAGAAEAARGGGPSVSPEDIANGARMLAAIHEGLDQVPQLVSRMSTEAGMKSADALSLLSSLSDAGLVTIDGFDATLSVHLTDSAKNALNGE